MTTSTFTLPCPVGFSPRAAASFYAGFAPLEQAQSGDDGLTLAFRTDGDFEAVGVQLSARGRSLHVEVEGKASQPALTTQLGRMLGLDADGEEWLARGRADPLLGALQARFPGFFTAGFPSPYEAGVSGVLSHRSSIAQAARVRRALSERHGDFVGGRWVMPSPRQLLAVKSFPGVAAPKLEVLHGLARAALDGFLDAERLRALPAELAMEQLQQLRGIGPWTAGHLLLRGASLRDVLPETEPRVLLAYEHHAGRRVTAEEFREAAQAWRPFRTWAAILLVRTHFASGAERRARVAA